MIETEVIENCSFKSWTYQQYNKTICTYNFNS